MAGSSWIKFYPSDYLRGVINTLSLEEEGLFWRICSIIYDRGNALPSEDVTAARMLGVQITQYRKILKNLIEKKKLFLTNSGYMNARVLHELMELSDQKTQRSTAAKVREQRKKEASESCDSEFREVVNPRHNPRHISGGISGVNPGVNPGVNSDPTHRLIEDLSNKINAIESRLSSELDHEGCSTRARSRYQIPDIVDLSEDKSSGLAGLFEEVEQIDQEKNALDAYVELAKRIGLPIPRAKLSEVRPALRGRIGDAGGLPGFYEILGRVEKSAFLCGQSKSDFVISLPWLLKASNFKKVRDGAYGNGKSAAPVDRQAEERKLQQKRELEKLSGGAL
jgi:uncharacterized protein YdaU (DUF1376 family)